MKTDEELNQLKTEYEALRSTLNELNEEELKLVTGGTGEGGYKYSFRIGDYVYISGDKQYRFVVDENIDTNDDNHIINGHRSQKGVKEHDVSYLTMTASSICSYYASSGGNLKAMY